MASRCACPPNDCAADLQRYCEGPGATLEALVKRHDGAVRRLVASVLNPAGFGDEVDECAQEGWLRLFSRLDRWKRYQLGEKPGSKEFCVWMSAVVIHEAIDYRNFLRDRKGRTSSAGIGEIEDRLALGPKNLAAVVECIEWEVKHLPDELRRVFELRLRGMSFVQIGAELGIREWTARFRFSKVRRFLHPCLDLLERESSRE